jgi:hypothetical protein
LLYILLQLTLLSGRFGHLQLVRESDVLLVSHICGRAFQSLSPHNHHRLRLSPRLYQESQKTKLLGAAGNGKRYEAEHESLFEVDGIGSMK